MKKTFSSLLVLLLLWGCGSQETTEATAPEDDVDAARMFIRAALDGNYKQARKLIVADSSNVQLLDNLERAYLHSADAMEQRGYRESTIRIHDTRKLDDTASVIVYSNSFKNIKDSVKAVRQGHDWLIDLKYSFPQTRLPE